jgi:hypothetical protein
LTRPGSVAQKKNSKCQHSADICITHPPQPFGDAGSAKATAQRTQRAQSFTFYCGLAPAVTTEEPKKEAVVFWRTF